MSFTVCTQEMQGAFIKCLKLPVTPECHFKKTAYVLSSFTVLSLAFLISVSFCPSFLLSLSPLLLIDNWKRIEDTGSPAVRSFISLFQLLSNESALLACVFVTDLKTFPLLWASEKYLKSCKSECFLFMLFLKLNLIGFSLL